MGLHSTHQTCWTHPQDLGLNLTADSLTWRQSADFSFEHCPRSVQSRPWPPQRIVHLRPRSRCYEISFSPLPTLGIKYAQNHHSSTCSFWSHRPSYWHHQAMSWAYLAPWARQRPIRWLRLRSGSALALPGLWCLYWCWCCFCTLNSREHFG